MLIQMQTKNEQDQFHIIQYIYFLNRIIYMEAIKYYFEHISRDNHLVFLFLILQILFEHVCSFYQ